MKNIKTLVAITSLITIATAAQAASHAAAPMVTAPVASAAAAKTDLPMTEGEIRKVDLESKKVTIKHGDIKNLDMPGMTMVFQVKDPAMLDKIKAGDKVKFSVEKLNGAIVVTNIQSAAEPIAATPMVTAPVATAVAAKTDLPMTEGEIRKVDLESKKVTIKHGDIKNLDMPGMTMVFQVKDPAMLDKIKTGDKVKFSAEKSGGAIVVTDIQPAK